VFGARRTLPGCYPQVLSGWPGSGRSSLNPTRAWPSAVLTRTGMFWPWHWLNPVARSTARERSSPAMATCPWSSSTLTCGEGVSAVSCCRDSTRVHRKGAGAVRLCGPGRRTRALDACTKARDTEGQAMRPPLATVTRSSSSSAKTPARVIRCGSTTGAAIGWVRVLKMSRPSTHCRALRPREGPEAAGSRPGGIPGRGRSHRPVPPVDQAVRREPASRAHG